MPAELTLSTFRICCWHSPELVGLVFVILYRLLINIFDDHLLKKLMKWGCRSWHHCCTALRHR